MRLVGLDVEIAVSGDRTVVSLVGELDLASAVPLGAALSTLPGPCVLVDLTGLAFCDATGIGVLVDARRRLVAAGGDLRLLGPSPVLRRVLALLSLEDALPVDD